MLRVLIVEDSAMELTMHRAFLSDIAQTVTAKTLKDGLAYANSGKFDAVILDLDLPDSMGSDTVEAFIEKAPPMPILVCSAHKLEGKFNEWVDSKLPKPVTKRGLVAAVTTITDKFSGAYLKQTEMRILEMLSMARQITHGERVR